MRVSPYAAGPPTAVITAHFARVPVACIATPADFIASESSTIESFFGACQDIIDGKFCALFEDHEHKWYVTRNAAGAVAVLATVPTPPFGTANAAALAITSHYSPPTPTPAGHVAPPPCRFVDMVLSAMEYKCFFEMMVNGVKRHARK